ncbi:CD225/dispanin family protein [Lysobacter humi (ex Lee et al. 2017)]
MSTPPPVPPSPPYQAPNAPVQPSGAGPVPNHMAWAIVMTVLSLCVCCIVGTIPGIVAIVFASKVNSALDRGDFAAARDASSNAKLWCWITTGLVIVGVLINIGLIATGGMASYMEQMNALQNLQQ